VSGGKPDWERPPQIPTELFNMLDLAITHMRSIAADIDVQPDPGLAAKTANAAIESNQARWQSFLGDVAEFHSRLMRHCLTLVARHYDQQRQIDVRGQYGWEPLVRVHRPGSSFSGQRAGAARVDRVEVPSGDPVRTRVHPGQLAGRDHPRSRPRALHGGSGEGLMRSYELDVARANLVVQSCRPGPAAMETFPPGFDESVGGQVPGWMPRKQDNLTIWKQVVGDFTKTELYDTLPIETQHIYELVYSGLEWLEQARRRKQAAQQQMQAESLGMGNAAKPRSFRLRCLTGPGSRRRTRPPHPRLPNGEDQLDERKLAILEGDLRTWTPPITYLRERYRPNSRGAQR
jgi:hypothetical protein